MVTSKHLPIFFSSRQRGTIRDHLKDWQQQQIGPTRQHETPMAGISAAFGDQISQSGADNAWKTIDRDDRPYEEDQYVGEETIESLSENSHKPVFLRMGDVVDLW